MEIHVTWKEFHYLIRNRTERPINHCDYTRDPNFYRFLGHVLPPEDVATIQAYNAANPSLAELVPMQVVKGARVRL